MQRAIYISFGCRSLSLNRSSSSSHPPFPLHLSWSSAAAFERRCLHLKEWLAECTVCLETLLPLLENMEEILMNIWGSTFLVENDFNFQNEPCPHDFKVTKHFCLQSEVKRYRFITSCLWFHNSSFFFNISSL